MCRLPWAEHGSTLVSTISRASVEGMCMNALSNPEPISIPLVQKGLVSSDRYSVQSYKLELCLCKVTLQSDTPSAPEATIYKPDVNAAFFLCFWTRSCFNHIYTSGINRPMRKSSSYEYHLKHSQALKDFLEPCHAIKKLLRDSLRLNSDMDNRGSKRVIIIES